MRGIGVPVITAAEIWSRTPEKILGLRRDFVEKNPLTVKAMIKAVIRAEQWMDADQGVNRTELVKILARPEYVGADASVLSGPLHGQYQYEKGDVRPTPEANVYFAEQAGYPFYGDAVWFLTQMRRWGQIATEQPDSWYEQTAKKVYRADLYRAAAEELIAAGSVDASILPPAAAMSAGTSRFIDGIEFDAKQPNAYLAKQSLGLQGATK